METALARTDVNQLRHYLDHPQEAGRWLTAWGVDDVERAHASVLRMALVGITTSADANIGNGYTLLSIAGVILGGGDRDRRGSIQGHAARSIEAG
jgi:hypothetical protein